LRAEQKKLEDEARAERSTAVNAAAAADAMALANNRTLQGFDMQTELSVNLLENQIKVNKKYFLINDAKLTLKFIGAVS
jgi:hypothetical protein